MAYEKKEYNSFSNTDSNELMVAVTGWMDGLSSADNFYINYSSAYIPNQEEVIHYAYCIATWEN